MNSSEKRRSRREDCEVPLSLVLATGSLEGRTINISCDGALIEADGQISITFILNGREYRGSLVRAAESTSGTMTYAVEFESPLSGVESVNHS